MDPSENPFRNLLAQPQVPLGTWLMSGAPSTAEAMGCIGFDWLVVDMEHVPIDFKDAYHLLLAIAGTKAVPVVRLSMSVDGGYSASPIWADGRIYFFSEEGKTTVIEAGRRFKVLAENELESGFMASPAVAGRALFLRTRTHLYRIEEPAELAGVVSEASCQFVLRN